MYLLKESQRDYENLLGHGDDHYPRSCTRYYLFENFAIVAVAALHFLALISPGRCCLEATDSEESPCFSFLLEDLVVSLLLEKIFCETNHSVCCYFH